MNPIPGLWIEQLPREVRVEARELIESGKVKVEQKNNSLIWTIGDVPPINTPLPSFGNTLLHAREAANMSQSELGKLIDPNAWTRVQGWISRLERGSQTTEVESLRKLCDLLDLPFPDQIIVRREDGEIADYHNKPRKEVLPNPDWKKYSQTKRDRKAAMKGHEPLPEPAEPPATVAETPQEPLGATLPFDRHPDYLKYQGDQTRLTRAIWDAGFRAGRAENSAAMGKEWDKLKTRVGQLENELVRERELRRAIIDTVDRLRTTT